jgi:phage terminase large subunit
MAGLAVAVQDVVEIPYRPRNWARELHRSFKRFSALVLHRRAGKTTGVVNHHLRYAMDDDLERQRLRYLKPDLTPEQLEELVRPPGGRHYGHVMPARNQAKLVVWDKLKYYASVIPGIKINESELLLKCPTGHKVQLFGADDPDALRGPAFSGLSFDEYSQQPRNIFSEVLSKALADHLGYAIFLGTIKGKDHLYATHEAFKVDPANFALWQDIDRSLQSEEGITIQLLKQAMEDDAALVRQGLMTQDEFDQEWFLSTDAAIQGAYYAKEMAKVKTDGRITRVPVDPMLPVDTDWDLGVDDYMSITFSQSLRSGEVRIVDYYENTGEGFPHYIKVLNGTESGHEHRKAYVYGKHHPPHDIAVREMSTGKSRKDIAAGLGLKFEEPAAPLGLSDGIDATRLFLAKCWFSEDARVSRLIECLRHYRKSYNQRLDQFTSTPVHDQFSHGADAFRTLAVRHKAPELKKVQQVRRRHGAASESGAWMK